MLCIGYCDKVSNGYFATVEVVDNNEIQVIRDQVVVKVEEREDWEDETAAHAED